MAITDTSPQYSGALPPIAQWLGLAGLLPQVVAVLLILDGEPAWRFSAAAMAFAYAALIFSFLGGMWWGLAARDADATPSWIWVAAVAPPLIALGSAWPWAVGEPWPGPSLVLLGASLIISPAIDHRLGRLGLCPDGWLVLRLWLSFALGVLTVIAGLAP